MVERGSHHVWGPQVGQDAGAVLHGKETKLSPEQEQHEAISHGDSAHREATRVSSVYGQGDAGRRALLSLPCTWDAGETEQKQNFTTRAHNGTNDLLS